MHKQTIWSLAVGAALLSSVAWTAPAAANCGPNIYMEKCPDCGPTGMITADRCKAVLENIKWNLEVLKGARCRLEQYEDWRDGANKEASEKLDDLIEQVAGFVLPGIKEGEGLASIPGKLNFAKKVIDLLEIQGTVIELLGNSQGSSFFVGMIRSVRSEIWHVSREINRAAGWYERNCPPYVEEEPFIEPLDPPPPPEDEEPEEVKKPKVETDPGEALAELPEYMRFFILWVTQEGEIDLRRHQLSASQWEHALGLGRPFAIAGFLRGLEENAYDDMLGRHNLQVLHGLRLERFDTGFIEDEWVDHFYHGLPEIEDLFDVEETEEGQWRVIEDPEGEPRR